METEKQEKWGNRNYMLHENELWLNEQAGKGLVLKSFDKDDVSFTETEKQNRAYKIIVLNEKKSEDQIKIIEHQGFTFVGSHDEYYIFYIGGNYGHIQPRLNEEMIGFAIKWFNKQIIKRFAGALIAIIPIALKLIFARDELLQSFVELSTIWYLIYGFIFISFMIDGIREYGAVIQTKKCFLEHEQYVLNRSPQKSNIMRICIITICIVAGIYVIKYLYVDPAQYSIADVQKELPIVLLQDIEGDKELSEALKVSQSTVNEDNYAEIKHTLMAPKQYDASQSNSDHFMSIRYYEVAVEKLAEPLAKELPVNDFADIKKADLNKIEYDGLDAVYYYKDGSMSFVSACKAEKVMFILYDGDKSIEDILREMAEVL